ncbi:MAG: hypothetical protein R3D84_06890 [Paracoccaceae bacterium]
MRWSVTGSGGHGGRSLIELDGLTGSLAPDFIAALRDGGGESSERGYLALGDSYGWGIEAVVQTVGDDDRLWRIAGPVGDIRQLCPGWRRQPGVSEPPGR